MYGLAQGASSHDSSQNPLQGWIRDLIADRLSEQGLQSAADGRVDDLCLVGAVEGQSQGTNGAGIQAGPDDLGCVVACGPQQDRLAPPWVIDASRQDRRISTGGAELSSCQVLLQRQVCKTVEAVFAFDQQAALSRLFEKHFGGDVAGHFLQRLVNRFGRVAHRPVTYLGLHHDQGEMLDDVLLVLTVQAGGVRKTAGFVASVQQHVTHLGVEFRAASGQLPAVAMDVRDHCQ
ncbi:hypothetical protein ACM01_26480 [Streptomyces viridochromogenes]|uniref:Uncharacterized protein n=1 Tax=Streptomyces viridochromogenes TaxID=1938 RepID=A0A0J7Z7Z5_STRVR|nr:hypothetical protein ACM01_26480 [Streptomyces viridochromogenes]KOG18768.1 hypothetical protein ADK36_21325 [Streptomyces viridochromogenes]KOG23638.1 hypothetical protein ADK35_12180 [Streptomyces viridochromogenes]